MEHLQSTGSSYQAPTVTQPSQINAQDNAAELEQHIYIKKDLTRVIILVTVLLLIIFSLMFLDMKSDKVQIIAEKITSLVIKQ
ncbi:MAG: hypothetical protein WCT27_01700 [Patescibacteria group bacterium]